MNINEIKSNYHKIDWLKSNCQKLHYFGLGFIQLKLSSEYRLHFYTSKLPPIVGDEDIHDHRYPFGSHILKGEFVQNIYQMIDGDKYVLEFESCQEGQVSEVIRECDFEHLNRSIYSEGSKYLISEDTFHNVQALHAITLVERPPFHCKDRARVAHLKGATKVCPFSKKVPEAELWDIVKEML